MRLTFLGAAREVTGSCTLLEACGKKILIDCGMEQGLDVYENAPLPVHPQDVDCVLLTHAHIDHSGKLPKLVADGFRNKIYATGATKQLCDIMLKDSAHIQEFEAQWRNRKAMRSGGAPYIPLYTTADVEKTMPLFVSCGYNADYPIFTGINVKFIDAGHLLGSSSIIVTATENGVTKKILFSGDVGNVGRPLIRDPQKPTEGDIVVIESTYGNRVHGERKDYVGQFVKIIQETFDRGGNVVIPAFAVGRTQEILYLIREIKEKNLITGHSGFPVWVDSPLAIEATKIYAGGMNDYYDAETLEMVKSGVNVLNFDGLKTAVSTEDSMRLNEDDTPKVIISASGMCEAGRIRHHLKHNLWRPECSVLFVGYQAEGTLGRSIIDGEKTVKLFGEEIQINARIEQIEGISGHADMNMLLDWLGNIPAAPQKVFVNHGNEESAVSFASTVREKFGYNVEAPYTGGKYDLVTGECLNAGNRVKNIKEATGENRGFTALFMRLKQAGERLVAVINAHKGASNRDLEKFTKQIDDLTKKWLSKI
jgi:metallo-beta-lactamase family protein